jgi:plastocyanin
MRVPFKLLAGALMTLCACSDYTSPNDGGEEPSATADVSVQDDQFVAASVQVLQGGTVRWTWRGGNQHNVTFTGGPASTTQTNGGFQRTFDTVGTFPYTCTIHGQSMSGRVTVVAASQAPE